MEKAAFINAQILGVILKRTRAAFIDDCKRNQNELSVWLVTYLAPKRGLVFFRQIVDNNAARK